MKTPILVISILASAACTSIDFSGNETDLDSCIQIGSVAGEGSNDHEIHSDLVRKAGSLGGNHIVPANGSTSLSIVQTLPPTEAVYSPKDLRDLVNSERNRPAVPVQASMVAYVYYCK